MFQRVRAQGAPVEQKSRPNTSMEEIEEKEVRLIKETEAKLLQNVTASEEVQKAFDAAINRKGSVKTPQEIEQIKKLVEECLFPPNPSLAPQENETIVLPQTYNDVSYNILYRIMRIKIFSSMQPDRNDEYVYGLVPVIQPPEIAKKLVNELKDGYIIAGYEACVHLLLIGQSDAGTAEHIENWITEKESGPITEEESDQIFRRPVSQIVITASHEWREVVNSLQEKFGDLHVNEEDFLPFNIDSNIDKPKEKEDALPSVIYNRDNNHPEEKIDVLSFAINNRDDTPKKEADALPSVINNRNNNPKEEENALLLNIGNTANDVEEKTFFSSFFSYILGVIKEILLYLGLGNIFSHQPSTPPVHSHSLPRSNSTSITNDGEALDKYKDNKPLFPKLEDATPTSPSLEKKETPLSPSLQSRSTTSSSNINSSLDSSEPDSDDEEFDEKRETPLSPSLQSLSTTPFSDWTARLLLELGIESPNDRLNRNKSCKKDPDEDEYFDEPSYSFPTRRIQERSAILINM